MADDDPKLSEIVRRYLVTEGHDVEVVADGRAAVDAVRGRNTDLLVLDVMMPRLTGFDVCRVLRGENPPYQLPILMLTARSDEDDLLDGLDLGADDYLVKPFSPRELTARVRALLRRGRRGTDDMGGRPVVSGALVVTPSTREVTFRGAAVTCTRGEFTLLQTLAGQPGRVFTRESLLTMLHGDGGGDGYISRRTVDVHIANLRKKLSSELIRTVYGVGYSLTESS